MHLRSILDGLGASEPLVARQSWIESLHCYVKPYWEHLLQGPWAEGIANGRLSLAEMQGWMLQIYPFIHMFPKFLAETLIKVEDDYSRSYYINNIRVEKAHAEHWLWMGTGFGVRREDMLALAGGEKPVLRDVQSLSDWLWYINTKGSLAEAAAATSRSGSRRSKSSSPRSSRRWTSSRRQAKLFHLLTMEELHANDPALARRESSMALLFAQQDAVGDQIESQVNAIVQSLQFQDIAAQSLSRALNRLSLLESVIGGPSVVARARKARVPRSAT